MKKRGFFILIMLLFLSACEINNLEPKLDYPHNVQLEEKILSWEEVEFAVEYVIVLNDEEIITDKNFFDFNALEDGTYHVRVKAKAEGYQDSLFSEPISFVFEEIIPAPDIEISGSLISWDPVPEATSYIIQINNVQTETTDNQIDLTDFEQEKNFNIKVKAKKNGKTSRFSSEINYQTFQNITNVLTIEINKNVVDCFEKDITEWNITIIDILDKNYEQVKTNEVFIEDDKIIISKTHLQKLEYGIQPLILITDEDRVLLNLNIYDDRIPYFIRGNSYVFNNDNKDVQIKLELYDEEILRIDGNGILADDYQIGDNEIIISKEFIKTKFDGNSSLQTIILRCLISYNGTEVDLPFYINRR